MSQTGVRGRYKCGAVWGMLSALTLSALTLLSACDGDPVASTPGGDGGAPSLTNGIQADAGADARAADASAGAGSASPPDWCAASAVLQAKCQRCHADPPVHGAPFPLLTYADTQAKTRDGSTRSEAIKAVLELDYMPPSFVKLEPPVAELTPSEKATLLAWLAAPVPAEPPSCE